LPELFNRIVFGGFAFRNVDRPVESPERAYQAACQQEDHAQMNGINPHAGPAPLFTPQVVTVLRLLKPSPSDAPGQFLFKKGLNLVRGRDRNLSLARSVSETVKA